MNIKSLFDKTKNCLSKYLFVFVYFTFFVLALVPTVLDSSSIVIPTTFITAYKGFLMVSLLAFICYQIIKKKLKISPTAVCYFSLIIIVYSIYIIVFPSVFSFVSPAYSYRPGELISIAFSKTMKLSSLFNVFSFAFFSFVSLSFIPSIKLGVSDLKIYLHLVCFFVLTSCIYALLFQSKSIFASDAYVIANPFSSFFGNKNTFGIFLMIATFSSCLLFYQFHLKRFALYSMLFATFSFLSRSTTAALLCTLIVVFTYFFFVVKSFFRKKIILFLLLFGPLTLLAFLVVVLVSCGHGSAISNFFKKLRYIDFNNFYNLFSGRGGYWAFGIYLVNRNFALLGYTQPLLDSIVFESVVNMYTTRSLTSTFLTTLDAYGVVGLSIYFYYLYMIIVNIAKIEEKNIKEMLMLLFIIYVIYGLFESYLLFDTKIGSLILTPLLGGFPLALSKKRNAESLLRNKVLNMHTVIEI